MVISILIVDLYNNFLQNELAVFLKNIDLKTYDSKMMYLHIASCYSKIFRKNCLEIELYNFHYVRQILSFWIFSCEAMNPKQLSLANMEVVLYLILFLSTIFTISFINYIFFINYLKNLILLNKLNR
jgi:hypothetical protein